ncbi:hypothetical protein DMN91_007436, partial [Ooceraea biroi]
MDILRERTCYKARLDRTT